MHLIWIFAIVCCCLIGIHASDDVETTGKLHALLYPRESESRDVTSLDGMWRFLKSNITQPMQGVTEGWYLNDLDKVRPTIPMPVPASYNDLTTDAALRDHVGTVWYEKKFFVPRAWQFWEKRVWLRLGSVHYAAVVWINGKAVGSHKIGHLPFEMEITDFVKFGTENRLTLMCDNTLTNSTIPQGDVMQIQSDNGMETIQTYSFDFFNYAGIHRSVVLYTTPKSYIQSVHLNSKVDFGDQQEHHASVEYDISAIASEAGQNVYAHIQLRNREGDVVVNHKTDAQLSGSFEVPHVQLWWPYLMHPQPAYLYQVELYLHDLATDILLDVYRLKFGIRQVRWNATSLTINDKPIYFRGFGRHEDSDLRGKGLDYALLTRDFNLLKWIGANAYRTSHYPYSEESMQFADEHGIMIVDECPSVNTDIFHSALLENHESALKQLILRDRNHASVIMWSISNEPRSKEPKAEEYFRTLANFTKELDPSRPITASINVGINDDKLAQFLDVISFNRYNAWYHNAGLLDTITSYVYAEAKSWHDKYQRPILMSEYGADTLESMHSLPTFIWSEEYQEAILSHHFKAFDGLRSQNWFIGEFLWNFADFKTAQTYTRVGGNKKGIFTRNRQPKTGAFLLRQRYHALAAQIDNATLPTDIFPYIASWPSTVLKERTEL